MAFFGDENSLGAPVDQRLALDSSQWSVATGSATRAAGGSRTDTAGPWDVPVPSVDPPSPKILLYVAAGGAALLILLVLLKRKKKG